MKTEVSGKLIIAITVEPGTDPATTYGILGEIDFEDRVDGTITDLADTIDNDHLADYYGVRIEIEDLLEISIVVEDEDGDEEEEDDED